MRQGSLLRLSGTNRCDQHDLPVCGVVTTNSTQATRISIQSRRDTSKSVTSPVCGLINSIRESKDPWKNQFGFPENRFQHISQFYICYTLGDLVSHLLLQYQRQWVSSCSEEAATRMTFAMYVNMSGNQE
jgi:hypothetical protein